MGNFGGDEALTNARAMNKEVGVNANRECRLSDTFSGDEGLANARAINKEWQYVTCVGEW
jgi:hypothetical protein